MTPKEKAKQLVEKFSKLSNYGSYALRLCEYTSKQCALIAVDEILSVIGELFTEPYLDSLDEKEYWQQVRTEIENL